MNKFGTRLALTVGVALASMAAVANELDGLQGAWVMAGTDCTDTFVKKGSQWQLLGHQSARLQ